MRIKSMNSFKSLYQWNLQRITLLTKLYLLDLVVHFSFVFIYFAINFFCRLLFWYFDPLILKHDASKILQESTKRPFLCLNTELYERVEWRSTVICLAISPSMFIETRNLLHNWFLLT